MVFGIVKHCYFRVPKSYVNRSSKAYTIENQNKSKRERGMEEEKVGEREHLF